MVFDHDVDAKRRAEQLRSENNRAMRTNSKAKRSDQQNKYIFAPQAARAGYVAHTPHPQPHTS
jgi:hypothetical protein